MFPESLPLLFVCALLIWVLVAFIRESWSPDIVVAIAVAVLLATQLLTPGEVLGVLSNSASDDRLHVHHLRGAGAHRLYRCPGHLARRPGRHQPYPRTVRPDDHRAGDFRLPEQHASGRNPHAGGDFAGQARRHHAVEAADSVVLRDHSRRHADHDRHVHQHPRRWRGAQGRPGAVRHVRDYCGRPDHGSCRHDLPADGRQASATGARHPVQAARPAPGSQLHDRTARAAQLPGDRQDHRRGQPERRQRPAGAAGEPRQPAVQPPGARLRPQRRRPADDPRAGQGCGGAARERPPDLQPRRCLRDHQQRRRDSRRSHCRPRVALQPPADARPRPVRPLWHQRACGAPPGREHSRQLR